MKYFRLNLLPLAALSLFPYTAHAVNECGVASAGATVICNNDGSPGSDTSPYVSGISYTIPVNLIVDGTVNPIISNERIRITSAAGPQSTTIIGDVTINRVNPGSGTPAIGDITADTRDISLMIGPDVDINISSTSSRSLYGIAARADNAAIDVESYADITITTPVGAATRGYSLGDSIGGANSRINAVIGGSINIDSMDGTQIYGIYASSTGAGSPQAVTVESSADIDITTTGSLTGASGAIYVRNINGDAYLSSSGEVSVSIADTSGFAYGLYGYSLSGQVTMDVTGAVDVNSSDLVYALISVGTVDKVFNVSADISAESTTFAAYGIRSGTTSLSNSVVIGDDISILATGNYIDDLDEAPAGIRLESEVTGDNDIQIGENSLVSGVASGGASAYGIFFGSGAYDVFLGEDSAIEAENLSTGADAYGIFAEAGGTGGTVYLSDGASLSAFSSGGDVIAFSGSNSVDNFTSYAAITGNISFLNGADIVNLLGGSLSGNADMGSGDDQLNLADMDTAGLSGIGHLDGGSGEDELTFTNIDYRGSSMVVDDLTQGINLMDGWETINFVNSDWRLTGDLTLGGSTVNIDNTSTLYAGNGVTPVISSIIPGDRATVNNAGIIDLTNGTSGATDSLTILGDYVGAGGTIRMNLAGNGTSFQSDRLIIDGSNGGGSASGNTTISLVDTQFLGGATSGNGVLLVETTNGATSTNGAFVLDTPTISAGAYTYRLEINNANDNWYLVSGFAPRDEIAADVTLSDLSHRLGLAMLGRMDDRQNDDGHKFWARSFGQFGQVGETGNFAAHGPEYDYTVAGGQMGMDIYRTLSMEKTRDVVGVYGASGHIKADVASPAGGNAGVSQMTGYSVGAYWSRFATQGWYLDTVAQAMFYDNVRSRSSSGETLTTHGYGAMMSVEGGKPYRLDSRLTLTPQIQVAAQKTKLNDSGDSFGLVDFRDANAVYTRVGAKLSRTLDVNDGPLFENGPVDVWIMPGFTQSFGADAKTVVTNLSGGGASTFRTDLGGSALLLNTGISANFSEHVSLFTAAEYSTTLSRNGNALAGKAGVKVAW